MQGGYIKYRQPKKRGYLHPYPIGRFALSYLLAILVMSLVASISGELLILAYFGCGFALNRYVLSRIRWHHHHDTLHNIFIAKAWSFLLWPISYPVLVFQLAVVRYL